ANAIAAHDPLSRSSTARSPQPCSPTGVLQHKGLCRWLAEPCGTRATPMRLPLNAGCRDVALESGRVQSSYQRFAELKDNISDAEPERRARVVRCGARRLVLFSGRADAIGRNGAPGGAGEGPAPCRGPAGQFIPYRRGL